MIFVFKACDLAKYTLICRIFTIFSIFYINNYIYYIVTINNFSVFVP